MIREFYPSAYAASVFQIDYPTLYRHGYRGILFDIDNTLVHHGDDSTPEIDRLFQSIHEAGLKTILLSNNDEERVRRFIRNIDTLYICDADKPDPEAYLRAVRMLGIKREEALCIGDQVFTDIRGANRSGIDSILVHFIKGENEKRIGKKRYLEMAILSAWRHSRFYGTPDSIRSRKMKAVKGKGSGEKKKKEKVLFCDRNPLFYKISTQKEIARRHMQDLLNRERFARTIQKKKLPNLVSSVSSGLIKTGPGIDPVLQENKAVNIDLACRRINGIIIRPGEVFSFWHTVGKTTRRKGYRDGRVIVGNQLRPGLGGGLCNLGNSIHLLIVRSPMMVTEFHSHSDALAPDPGWKRVPFSAGTAVSYNYIDYRFRNDTDQNVQLLLWCEDGLLKGELRSERAYPWEYRLAEEDHHFHREGDNFYRISRIYKETLERESGKLEERTLLLNNHSKVMFDPTLSPEELIR